MNTRRGSRRRTVVVIDGDRLLDAWLHVYGQVHLSAQGLFGISDASRQWEFPISIMITLLFGISV